MPRNEESALAGALTSKTVWLDSYENSKDLQTIQSRSLSRRFGLSPTWAAIVAPLAYGQGGSI